MKNTVLIIVVCMGLIWSSCSLLPQVEETSNTSFEKVKGVRYIEVKRKFLNGLSINSDGFHLEPQWQIYFTGDDSVKILDPDKRRYNPYRIFHSHKNLFHFAGSWFRVKHVSTDSLVLQPLLVRSRVVNEEASIVLATFYSEDYVKNRLHSSPEILRKPSAQDSAYVKYKARMANNSETVFAARKPVLFKSKSKILSVRKIDHSTGTDPGPGARSDDYMYPAYTVHVHKAYRNFKYSIYVLVDEKGKLKFNGFQVPVLPEFYETKSRVATGIVDVYLSNLLEVTPGSTLGYPHSTIVRVNVIGTDKRIPEPRSIPENRQLLSSIQ